MNIIHRTPTSVFTPALSLWLPCLSLNSILTSSTRLLLWLKLTISLQLGDGLSCFNWNCNSTLNNVEGLFLTYVQVWAGRGPKREKQFWWGLVLFRRNVLVMPSPAQQKLAPCYCVSIWTFRNRDWRMEGKHIFKREWSGRDTHHSAQNSSVKT